MIELIFVLSQHLTAQAQTPKPPTRAELTRFSTTLDSLRQRLEIPGLSAAIVYHDSVIWSRGYGFADVAKKTAATPHTPYEVASLSKPIAAVMLIRLVSAGKVSLDDPMSKWSSDYQTDSVHVWHLLTHTSEGVPGTRYEYNGDRYTKLANSDALSMSFKLALGDVTQSPFACAFLAIEPADPASASSCVAPSHAKLVAWRTSHRLPP